MTDKKIVFNNIVQLICESSNSSNHQGFHLGYELNVYRQKALADFIARDIVGYCLTDKEYKNYLNNPESEDFIKTAWNRISTAQANKKGDWGEFILYAILKYKRDISNKLTKVKIKTARGDQVKGFDCAHFKVENKKLTLVLGESKFHQTFYSGLSQAMNSIKGLLNMDKTKDEISLLIDHLENESEAEDYTTARNILNSGYSLDNIKFVIPIFLTYNSDVVDKFNVFCENYEMEIKAELEVFFKKAQDKIAGIPIYPNFKFLIFILPFKDIDSFRNLLEEKRKIYD